MRTPVAVIRNRQSRHGSTNRARPRGRTRPIVLHTDGLQPALQRKPGCACGGGCPRCQAKESKLAVGAPDSAHEREADRVADAVLRMPDGAVQRQIDDDEAIQAKSESGAPAVAAPGIDAQVAGLRGGGAPLPAADRAFFEPRFGSDFSAVRLHAGPNAAQAARGLSARAFTVGSDIAFGAGQYRPGTADGRRLLAHELTHVVQQSPGASRMISSLPTGHTPSVQRAVITETDDCPGVDFPSDEVWYADPRLVQIREGQGHAFLRAGSSGASVRLVQQAITAWGCDDGFGNLLPRFGVDGIFGMETHGAVTTFQAEQHLETDGIVGPITLGELDQLVEADTEGDKPPPLPPNRARCNVPFGLMTVVVGETGCQRICLTEGLNESARFEAPCCALAGVAFRQAKTNAQRDAVLRRYRRWTREPGYADFLICKAATAALSCADRELTEKNCPEGDPKCCSELAEFRKGREDDIAIHCPVAPNTLPKCPFFPGVS